MKKITAVICVIFAFIMMMALPVSASAPYQTYTYSINGTALHSPDAYNPAKSVDSAYMGLDDEVLLKKYYSGLKDDALAAKKTISNPSDLEVDDEMNVYIADTDNNRIVVLDRYYKVKFIIESFINEQGVPDKLSAPQGVFITPDKRVGAEEIPGRIFVCDTNNNRIITFDRDGNFLSVIPQPESELFDEGAVYKPVAVAVDQYDRLYVVSSTTYQGIIVMTDEGQFTGFVGAQKVVISAWDSIWRRFQTEEQRALSQSYVSTEFNNIALFDDFIYVTTSSIDENNVQSAITGKSTSGDYAPVKMLNAAGTEIMRRNGFYPPSGEVDMKKVNVSDEIFGVSTIVDVATGPEKTWSIIDQKRSKVFTYDYDGNLLFAFGDTGRQLGNISSKGLAAVVYQGDNMLLLDRTAKSFTVYERTEYGDILINALHNQNQRSYDRAIDDWMEILKRNSNFDAAYIGIGNALYRSNDLEEALEYYKAAYDTENYSVAYKDLRKEWLSNYIILIPIVVIAVAIAWSKLLKHAKKVNKRVATSGEKKTYGQEIIYVFHVIFHPFDGFWDLKHEKRGSLRAAITILAAVIVAFYYQAIGQGYLLNPQENYSTIIAVILSVGAPFALWTIANWCLTTLFDGEGSYKDIFIATCYALAPMVIILIPTTLVSNVLVAEELDILSVINAFAFIWAGILIFFGMMVTHDYPMGKNFLTTLGTILGMVVIMFIAILFSTLLGKLVSFVTNIVTEIQFRV
ncbi:MAG: YIP1 family protein [Clostridia bacterium]|nr:YIP1 family protein [Clostridia bacterium]